MKKTTCTICLSAGLIAATAGLAGELPVFSRAEAERARTEVPLVNADFEGRGGWVDAEGKPFRATTDTHAGRGACRLDNTLVKSGPIPLAAGEELQFEAYTKVDNLRTIEAELAYFAADGSWLRRGSGPLARGDQYSWQHITGRHEITDPEVRSVVLQFYGAGELDDIRAWKLAAIPESGDQAKAKQSVDLPRQDCDTMFYFANDAYEFWVSRTSGMMVQLNSLQPTAKVIQPAGENAMQLYMKSRDPGVDGDFNRAVSLERSAPDRLVAHLTSDDPAVAALAEADVTYRLLPDRLEIRAEIRCKQDDPRPFQLGLRNVFRADEWQRNIYMSFPVQARPPETAVRATFYYAPDDDSVKNMGSGYPCAVLEGGDRYLLWGNYDLGQFTMLTPNDISWRLPSQQVNPTRLTAGKVQRFDSVYAVLPKAGNELTQVVYQYLDHVYSSNPLMTDLIRRQPADRYFTEGAFAWYHPGAVPTGYDGWRQAMVERHANNVWFSWWTNWDEVCPTEGEWWTYDGRRLSAEGLKSEIDYMKRHDLNVYLYFRQFLVEDGTYEDRPPYKKWLGRDQEGKRIPFIDFPFPHPELLNGLEKIRWTMADFGDADYRAWYLDMVKRSIDFYQPSGVAWDMGFGATYSAASPETGIGNGTLWGQAMIYQWLQEKYPSLRVATNEAIANPSGLFADAILIEGAWDVCGKSELDYQVAAAQNAALFSLQLTDDYIIQGAPEIDLTPYTHMLVHARGERLATASVGLADIMKYGFVPDGSWQWISVPLTLKSFRMLGVGLTADASGDSWLEVGDMALVSEKQPGTRLEYWSKGTPAEDFVRFSKWSHHLPTAGSVSQTPDGVRFTAEQPDGVSDTWLCITPVRAKWVKTNLKTLALGAICSDAQIPAFEKLNAFAAELAAMRRLSASKVIYDAPEGVFGTFWARGDRTAGTVYNDSGRRQHIVLHLNRASFPDRGAALSGSGVNMRLVDDYGRMREAGNFTLTPRENDIVLEGELDPGRLLLISNW